MTHNNKGFTLIELLVSIGIAGVVIAATYATLMGQQNSYKRQEQITDMQQNVRAAMTFMARETRMSGADPLSTSIPSIRTAQANTFSFTLDISGGETDGIDNDDDGVPDNPEEARFTDGDVLGTDEDITYSLYDAYGDGDTDIGRNPDITGTGTNQPLAENIDVLNFVYFDGNGLELTPPIADPTNTIRAVEIIIVARTAREFPNYTDNTIYSYVNQAGSEIVLLDKQAAPDGFRRKMVRSVIHRRN